jgi:putative protease
MAEQKIGTVTDYYAKIGVAAIHLSDGDIQVGDRLRFKGHTTDFTQAVESLQVEHQPVPQAGRGSQVAVKVRERVRKHDEVLRVTEG